MKNFKVVPGSTCKETQYFSNIEAALKYAASTRTWEFGGKSKIYKWDPKGVTFHEAPQRVVPHEAPHIEGAWRKIAWQ